MEDTKNGQPDQKPTFKYLLVEDVHTKYKTLLNKTYHLRKPYKRKNDKILSAFIPGTILDVYVKPNSKVVTGEKLLLLEAMKMNNKIIAPFDGVIKTVNVLKGDKVKKNTILIEFK